MLDFARLPAWFRPLLEVRVQEFMGDEPCDRVRLLEDVRADKCAAAPTDAALHGHPRRRRL
jgi:hypothetical protein